MDIVYACDDKYAMLAGVSIESLYASNKDIDELNVYILVNQLSKENKSRLCCISNTYHREIIFVEFIEHELCGTLNIDAQFWSVAAFARLFTPLLLPKLHKILYLDCDIMVLHSLKELLQLDLNSSPCAAVSEPFSVLHRRNIGMSSDDVYYNSGIMLIDLDIWRKEDILKDFLACIERHNGRVPYVDQGVINEVFRGRIATLPAKYNVSTIYFDFSYEEAERYRAAKNEYPKSEVEAAKKSPAIVHFNSSFLTPRPWVENSTHPYAAQWESCCARTPWHDVKKWPDQPGTSKLALRWIFRHTPRPVGVWVARLVNSIIRPLLKR